MTHMPLDGPAPAHADRITVSKQVFLPKLKTGLNENELRPLPRQVGIDFVRLSRVLNLPTADQDLQMRHERKRLMVLTKALQQELLQRRSQLEKKKPQGAGKQQEKKDRSRGAGGGAGFS